MRCRLVALSLSLPYQHGALCHQHQVGGSSGLVSCMSVVAVLLLYSMLSTTSSTAAMITGAAVAFNPPSAFINRGHQRTSSLESSQVTSQIHSILHSASGSSLSTSVGVL